LKISNTTGAVYGSPETPKKVDSANKIDEAIAEAQKSDDKMDSYQSEAKIVKKAVPFDGAVAKISFRNITLDGIVEFNFSKEAFSKLSGKFGSSLQKSGENEYIATDSAEKYLAASYRLFQFNMKDMDGDGKINFEEYKESNNAILGYDDLNNMPILAKLKDHASDESIIKYEKFNRDDLKSLDELFSRDLLVDNNLDGVIQKAEIEKSITTPNKVLESLNKLVLMFGNFLDDDDEEKKKKYAEAVGMDINTLKLLATDVRSFSSKSSPLVKLLTDLKNYESKA